MQDKAHELTEKQLKKLEKELNTIYSKAFKEAKEELYKVMEKINKIPKEVDPLGYYKEMMKYNRLQTLIEKLGKDIQEINKIAVKMLNGDLLDVYEENFLYGQFLAEKVSSIDLMYITYTEGVIKDILLDISSPFTQIALDDVVDRKQIEMELKREFTAGLINGESIPLLSKRLQKVIEKNLYEAIRIARTEYTRIQNSARLESFKKAEELGLKLKKRWLSTSDSRTRKSHLIANGQTVDLDKEFNIGKSKLRYPGDYLGSAKEVINCRCTMITEFIGLEKTELEKQLDKDLANMKYEEWKRRKNNGKS